MIGRDPLVALASRRKALIANKARDFAAERCPNAQWPERTHDAARSLATGQPIRTRSREDYNADERKYASHALLAGYRDARRRALIGAPLYDLAFREELIRRRIADRRRFDQRFDHMVASTLAAILPAMERAA